MAVNSQEKTQHGRSFSALYVLRPSGTRASVKVNVLQCALGLVVDGQPIYKKNTSPFASSTLLLEPFRGLNCICNAHGALDGCSGNVAKTKLAQVWPRETCHRICTGIQRFLGHIRRSNLVHDSDAVYPVDGMAPGRRQRRGRPRKNPEGIVTEEGVIYDCLVCMGRLHKFHQADT